MDYEKLGDNIHNYREMRGFTQEKLAEPDSHPTSLDN